MGTLVSWSRQLSMNASLPQGPPVNTDIDYYQTFHCYSDFLLYSLRHAMLVMLNCREKRSQSLPHTAECQARLPLVPFIMSGIQWPGIEPTTSNA